MRSEDDVRARLAEVQHMYDRYIVENAGKWGVNPDAHDEQKARYRAAIWTLEWVLGNHS